MTKEFWYKVEKCEHKNMSPDYNRYIPCGTPYCSGHEYHCLDCGVYITRCGCGFNNGMSGWSDRRWRAIERQKEIEGRKNYAKNIGDN